MKTAPAPSLNARLTEDLTRNTSLAGDYFSCQVTTTCMRRNSNVYFRLVVTKCIGAFVFNAAIYHCRSGHHSEFAAVIDRIKRVSADNKTRSRRCVKADTPTRGDAKPQIRREYAPCGYRLTTWNSANQPSCLSVKRSTRATKKEKKIDIIITNEPCTHIPTAMFRKTCSTFHRSFRGA